VNGRKVDVPSFRVKPGMRITLRSSSREIARVTEALEALERRSVPGWLELEKEAFTGVMKAAPTREDITMPIQEQLIVELYSR
jgi:small subunit ribosomal protein S4